MDRHTGAMDRRSFLAASAAAAAAACTTTDMEEPSIPIIDTHVHLFDTRRPGGIPWPPADDEIRYKPTLPDQIREVAEPVGVVGAIELECSPLVEDNQWVLDVMEPEPFFVGTVGSLEPGEPEFRPLLDRFAANPLFRGVRYGNIWDRDLRGQLDKPDFVEGLRYLVSQGLSLDTANQTVELLEDVIRATDLVPDLRVIIDHLPNLATPAEPARRAAYESALSELGSRPRVFVKLSAVLQDRDGEVAHSLEPYRAKLDEIFEAFGEDRVLFGSDWPNSAPLGSYGRVLSVVREYFDEKGPEAAEKYFWRNSVRAYGWTKRAANQPG